MVYTVAISAGLESITGANDTAVKLFGRCKLVIEPCPKWNGLIARTFQGFKQLEHILW